MGFIRRFGFYPPRETITAIEGVSIIDLAPPGSITGVGTGTVCAVGEFVDMGYAIVASSTGVITAQPQPQEVFSPADMLTKFGGFDSTLGDFGRAGGNGFASLRNKTFQRLVILPVDLVTPTTGSCYGVRLWRELPTSKSATDPTPIVPVSAGQVSAGREFVTAGLLRARTAQRVVFEPLSAIATGVNGAATAAGSAAATQPFDRAAGSWVTDGAQVGDALVIGVLGASGAQGANAGTFRIVSITDADTVVLEKLDGSTFDWTTGTSLVWRLHPAAAFDSGAALADAHAALATTSAYALPARPMSATIAAATGLSPVVVPDAASATAWDALSGLGGITHPTGALTFDSVVHGTAGGSAYPVNSAGLAARYQLAFDALLNDDYPAREINVVVSARKYTTIRAALKAHVLVASERGLTRRTQLSPELTTVTIAAVVADADPGVGANRNERVDYAWPGALTFVPEAVGTALATADGRTTTDGMLDDSMDFWLASLESNLPPERNPGQAAPPVPRVLAGIAGFQRGIPKLGMPEYILMRSKGVVSLRFDRVSGPQVQSGITTSLLSGEKNILRRRMADYIQDSISARLDQLAKLPMTTSLQDTATSEVEAFLSELKGDGANPANARIRDYIVDPRSGNTQDAMDAGIFVIITKVKLIPTADFLVLQTDIGEGTVVTRVLDSIAA